MRFRIPIEYNTGFDSALHYAGTGLWISGRVKNHNYETDTESGNIISGYQWRRIYSHGIFTAFINISFYILRPLELLDISSLVMCLWILNLSSIFESNDFKWMLTQFIPWIRLGFCNLIFLVGEITSSSKSIFQTEKMHKSSGCWAFFLVSLVKKEWRK